MGATIANQLAGSSRRLAPPDRFHLVLGCQLRGLSSEPPAPLATQGPTKPGDPYLEWLRILSLACLEISRESWSWRSGFSANPTPVVTKTTCQSQVGSA
jgi:hypothetical protein